MHEFIWTFFEAISISSLYQFWRSLVEAMEITELKQEVMGQIIQLTYYPTKHNSG